MKIEDFRYQYSLIKNRCSITRNTKDKHRKVHELDFGIEYLKEIWDDQQGICPLTGLSLLLKTKKNSSDKLLINHASVDRIDHKLGYIKGNIRFICVIANFALNNQFTYNDLLDFSHSIIKYAL